MSEMSDVPVFANRSWLRQHRAMRTAVAATIILAGAVTWCFSDSDPAQDISIQMHLRSPETSNGAPLLVGATVRNNGSRSAQINLQLALFVKESACLAPGRRVPDSFSLPMKLSVAPNGIQTVQIQFESIKVGCPSSVGFEVFADGKMDLDRFSVTRKLDVPTVKVL